MATRSRATMVANVRAFIQDTSSTAQAFSDAQLTKWINTGLLWIYEFTEKRVKYVTLISSWGGDVVAKDGDATCLYPEILEVSSYISGTDLDTPLERMGWNELRKRQAENSTTGTPYAFAALKYGGAAVSAAAQNKWKFALYPIPSGTTVLSGVVRDYPVQLSADADLIDLGEWEAECVEIIASIIAAPRMGRSDLAADLMGLLPKWIQDKLTTHATRDEVNA